MTPARERDRSRTRTRVVLACLFLSACAASQPRVPAPADQRTAAEAFMARSFEAVQRVKVTHDGRVDEGDAQLWFQPGAGFRFRVLTPLSAVAFEVASFRCLAFERKAGQEPVVSHLGDAKFPFLAFNALLAPLSNGEWRGDTYVEAKRRVRLGRDGRVQSVEGEGVSVRFDKWATAEGAPYPVYADFVLPGGTKLHVENRQVTFVVSTPAEAVPELRTEAEACP